MLERILIGNKLIRLEEVNSTNEFLKKYYMANPNEPEGLVVSAKNQYDGRGQKSNIWESESAKNLTFSILLKPNILIANQFDITKIISIGLINFLKSNNILAKIKWPNDIYVGDTKIAGVLIENTISHSKIKSSIVGVGLNVNQIHFNQKLGNASSLSLLTGQKFNLEKILNEILCYIDQCYLLYKTGAYKALSDDYLFNLFRFNEDGYYEIENNKVFAKIIGVSTTGKLQLKIDDKVKEFDMKEIKFLF